ncbi:MAG: hypothetical protein RJA22_994 [Verrucomicrobiota bacterium]|jgi:SAM-dependent methyltransferase
MLGSWLVLALSMAAAPAADRPTLAAPVSTAVATNHYERLARPDPDGIGKAYLGREISRVMGHQAADWLERPEREAEEHVTRMLEQLGLRPGDVVADIGCGTGYHARRMARLVGPGGRVLGVDIQPEMLDMLVRSNRAAGVTNVVPVLGTISDPKLQPESIDLALLVDVYHELEYPREMMLAIRRALKPGGRVVLVEFRAEDPNVPIKRLHRMAETQARREMAAVPLEWVETIGVLPWQHILVFRKSR